MPNPIPRLNVLRCALVCVLGCATSAALAGSDATKSPLHERIDRLIEASAAAPATPLASDSEFLRRVALDLTGMPPSPDEVRAFLADPAADKRAKVVDRLLESPLHARFFATTLDLMLMERRPNQSVTDDEWHDYLLTAARENRPLNLLFREILGTDGTDPKLRPAARFYLDRGAEPNLITRDVGRIVFGRDMQCAQCHNHPLIEDYQQSDYHGLLAFFSSSYALTRKEAGKDKLYYAEKAGVDQKFDSVFVKNDAHLTGPRLLGGAELIEPELPPGAEYRIAPADNVLPVPKSSRRAQLAALATDGSNLAFNHNIANRLWAVLMGRGLVHPLDLHHPANPPSNPALLAMLADELVALRFDARAFLRELALTRTYQRSIDTPAVEPSRASEIASALAEAKAGIDTLTSASEAAQEEYGKAIRAWHKAESALVPAVAEVDQALAKHVAASKKLDDAEKAVNALAAAIATRGEASKLLAEAASKARDVLKKLPKEPEVAAAAQKLEDRAKALTAEIAGLQKTTPDKAAALKKASDERAAAAKPVEAARSKTLPLRTTVRAQERLVIAARRRASETRVALEERKKRVDLLETELQVATLRSAAEASSRTVAAAREAVDQSEKRAAAAAADRVRGQSESQVAEQARVAAAKAVDAAQTAFDRHQKSVASVDAARAAVGIALGNFPNDADLSKAAALMKAKADELHSVTSHARSALDGASTALRRATEARAAAERALGASSALKTRRDAELVAARQALSAAEAKSQELRSELAAASEQLTTMLANNFETAQLKPLTPEQFCWSILKATGVYDRTRLAAEAELNKTKPLTAQTQSDPAQVRDRARAVEERTFAKLKGSIGAFARVYGAGAGQPQNDFFATADQALFAANGGDVNGWIAPAGGNVTDRLARATDPRKAAEDLYLTILARMPTAAETNDVATALQVSAAARTAAAQELVWGLLTSVEFRFNH
ncbi:MAG: DUF1549 domain-containing protein [Planctomycetota bacterium]|nr:DUF1549 domain-containing protein [Planctomycetota bacterium]